MNKPKILVVDDSEFNRKVLINTLKDEYETIEASNGVEALNMINKYVASLSIILLDIMMPQMNGIEVLKILNENGIASSIPIILITAADSNEGSGLKLGAVDFISKPFDPDIVKIRVGTQIKLKTQRDSLEELLEYNMRNNEYVWDNAVYTLATIAEFRSLDLFDNAKKSKDVAHLIICELMKNCDYNYPYSNNDSQAIISSIPLRDIGKIFIPDKILFKPGKLTDEEFELMKKHAEHGSKIAVNFVNDTNDIYVKHCIDICKSHHENWDGTGYPNKLKGEQIPLSARITAIIDVYDALVSKRVYKIVSLHNDAMDIIERESGKKFDPHLVNTFISLSKKIQDIYNS